MTLRPYQERAISEARDHVAAGRRGVVIVSATGTGKTRTGTEIARLHVSQGGRVLWLAHRVELVDQAVRALSDAGIRCGTIAAQSRHRPNPHAAVQVGSIGTMLARPSSFDPTLIVYDEVHHAAAELWSTLLTRWPDSLRIGLTATPERADGVGLGELFDSIVVAASIRDATDLGYLAPLDVVAPDRPLSAREIAQRPVDAYLAHASGRQAVVFAPHVKAAEQYASDFSLCGVSAGVVTAESRDALPDYEAGRTRVLCNVGVLTEGWDHPPTGVCILARGCGSAGLYIQIVGRVLRPHPSKQRALLIDLRGVVHIHGRPDEERVYSLDGKGIRRANDLGTERFCPVCSALMTGPVCTDCGRESDGTKSPTVVNAPLRVLARDALRGDPPERRVQRLARWMREAADRGHKPGAAMHKFKACYASFPTTDEMSAARRMI